MPIGNFLDRVLFGIAAKERQKGAIRVLGRIFSGGPGAPFALDEIDVEPRMAQARGLIGRGLQGGTAGIQPCRARAQIAPLPDREIFELLGFD